jgi:microcystin-dependent protein
MNKFNLKMKVASTLAAATLVNLFGISNAIADAPFIAEIRQFPYTFCPRGWAETDGRLLPIAQNTALFSLIGTIYGGDGRTTVGLPNIQGRVVKGQGNGPGLNQVRQGETGGADSLTLTINQLPSHSHGATTTTTVHATSADGSSPSPDNALLADDGRDRIYNMEATDTDMSSEAITSTTTLGDTGNAAPVNRRQPYLAMRYCIALVGTFPSRN